MVVVLSSVVQKGNILIIHQHFYPEPSGTAKSAYEIARYLAKKNYEVEFDPD